MSVAVTQHKMFIGGEFVDSSSGETMEVLNPATGEVIAEVPRGTADDVERAVAAAKTAWDEWRFKTPKDRMELLLKLADVIDENAEELARLESRNVGKPWWVAVDEPGIMSDNLRFFAGAARNLEGKAAAEYVEGYTSMIRREPLGIVAGICPWNYPLFMAVWKMGPALAAGNVQIIKPAEQTPLTMLRFVELAQEVLPPGVLQVVTGDGVPVGDALVRHPAISLVSLTGDTATGKLIAKNAADTVKHVHLELGGKAPMIVLDDADPATVAEAIKIGGYFNSGQDCTASSRILVSSRIYDDVLAETVEDRRVADRRRSRPPTTRSGWARSSRRSSRSACSASSSGPSTRRRPSSPAAAPSATAATSSKPTIVADVAQDAEIVQNEVFGPVVTVQSFSSDEEAVAMANDIRYGLASSVFSENVGTGAQGRRPPRLRLRLDQRAPVPADAGDAARRLQGVGLRQGHVRLLDGGVHAGQARLREAGVGRREASAGQDERATRLSGRRCASTCRQVRARVAAYDSRTLAALCIDAMRRGGKKHLALRTDRDIAESVPGSAARGPVRRARSVDAVDKGIIEALQRNGREPFRRIAAGLGVSEATIRARYARLRDDNILQVTGVTNPLGLGFEAQAMVGIRTAGPPERVADEIARWDEADYVVVTAGQFDVLVELVCADRRALLDVTNRIRALPDVITTESFLYLELWKQLYDWGARVHEPTAKEAS